MWYVYCEKWSQCLLTVSFQICSSVFILNFIIHKINHKRKKKKITTTIFSSVFAPQLNTDACTDTFFSLCTQKCVHVMEFWPMSFQWSCYMRMYGHHFKGSNDTAIIFMLFLQLAFWSTALISGVSPVYLDHEDKTHNTGMVELRVGRRLCFWWFREAAIATLEC